MKRVLGFIATGALILGIAAGGTWLAINQADQKTSAGSQNQSTSAPKERGEGDAVDVISLLLTQGWSRQQITPVQTNSSFVLAPFKINNKKGDTLGTCVFRITNVTYPGSGPVGDFPIKSRSTVRITAEQFTGGYDGWFGDEIPGSADGSIRDITPQYLRESTSLDLSSCESTVPSE